MEKIHSLPVNDQTERFEKIRLYGEQPLHKRSDDEKNEILEETFEFFREFLLQQ